MIGSAFQGVSLGNGVSLHESEALERHDCEVDRFAARELDEKTNWKLHVQDPELSQIATVGGPIFMDAEGFRFYLPAYLTLMLLKEHHRICRIEIYHLDFSSVAPLGLPCHPIIRFVANSFNHPNRTSFVFVVKGN